MLQQQSPELLTSLYENLERATLHPQAEVQCQALQVDAVAGQQLHVRIVDETDAVQVDYPKVWSMRFDLTDVNHFVDFFSLLVRQLKRSYIRRVTNPYSCQPTSTKVQ